MNDLMKHVILLFALYFIGMFAIDHANSAERVTFKCHYSYENESIELNVNPNTASFDKNYTNNGLKYTYHIENITRLNEANDYVEIDNNKGQRIIYPLNCEKK